MLWGETEFVLSIDLSTSICSFIVAPLAFLRRNQRRLLIRLRSKKFILRLKMEHVSL